MIRTYDSECSSKKISELGQLDVECERLTKLPLLCKINISVSELAPYLSESLAGHGCMAKREVASQGSWKLVPVCVTVKA